MDSNSEIQGYNFYPMLHFRRKFSSDVTMDLMVDLTSYNYVCWGARSSPGQMPTTLLTTALIVWLDYHPMDGISNLDSLLEVTVTPLRVPLTMEHSTRFIL